MHLVRDAWKGAPFAFCRMRKKRLWVRKRYSNQLNASLILRYRSSLFLEAGF